jgi:hypothetical protein
MKMLTKLGDLSFENGWMGGRFLVDKKIIAKADLPSEVVIEVNGKTLKAVPFIFSGEDYDHGHCYAWKALDFTVTLNSEIGEIKITLRNLIDKLKLKSIPIYIES